MADALLIDLLKQLGSFAAQKALQELQLLAEVDDEVQKLQHNFTMVQAVLDDAYERQAKQRTERTEECWLEQLTDAYYMIDDVLDSWKTAKIKSQIQKEAADSNAPALEKMKKVCSFFSSPSCCFNLCLRHDISHKIKQLNETLDKILKEREMLGINLNRQRGVDKRPPTTSFVDESIIIGRDKYRDDLVSNLLGMGSQEERNPRVISLVGMGGMGKSNLAQLAYNHPEVKAHFPIRMWVCVADIFEPCKVAKAIIQEVDPNHESINKVTEFQTLLHIIHDLIGEKKFFLVLDDVWTEDDKEWESFRNVLKYGAQGSRILVTTRKRSVAKMMDSSYIIDLGELSVDDCWLIIRKIAFFGDNLEQYNYLEDLGKQLAIKCKGLPLAAKTLGSHMRGKKMKEEWEKALHSCLWELEDIKKGILGPLLLSYYELSPAEKQCFLFCAVFPKDYDFDRLELVYHWMAQGYIDSKAKMEDIAENYFENLVLRSFFQDFKKDENDGRIVSCKMHDILHDFAESMVKDVCFIINCDDNVEKNFKRVRHLSLIVKETFLESVYEAKNLRFLNLNFLSSSKIVQPKLFDHLRCLRTLHLKSESILKLPNEVEKLIHLRYLKLSCEDIKELPESICNLCNLLILDVIECRKLEKLAQGIGKLINLRHLLFDEDFEEIGIKSFPKGIGRLTCLKTLISFPIGVGGKGEEICKLTCLKRLSIICCVGLEWLPPLGKLPLLEELKIGKAPMIQTVGDEFLGIDMEELESKNKDIIIFPNLKSLKFNGLEKWEEWFGMGGRREDNTPIIKIMPHLHSLEIWGCGNLKSLPAYLRNTPLKELKIKGCPILEQHCERGIGDCWPNISHIRSIQIDDKYVQRDGQLPDSVDSEMHDDVVEVDKIEGSNHEEDDGDGFKADEQVVEINIDEEDL